MSKASSPSFVLTLRLETDNVVLDKRFKIANHIYNVLVKHARKAISQLKQDKEYQAITMKYRNKLTLIKEDKAKLSALRIKYGLSEYQFHEYVIKQKQFFTKHIDINTAQKIATAVWKSVEVYLFKKGKTIHFKKSINLSSVEGKTNKSGIRFKQNTLHWKGLVIPVRIKKKDVYAKDCLSSYAIKYCRIIRKWHKHNFRYYVQLVLRGIPPQRNKISISDSRVVGIDPGTSTMAIVSKDSVIFTELGKNVVEIEKDIKRLNRKSDRQRRSNNSNNYNIDGTIKRVNKGCKRKWIISKRHRCTIDKTKELYRKRAESLRYEHNKLANQVLSECGTDIYSEQMSYKGLQLRSSKTEISEKTGTFKRKKRFGKSLLNHAPSMFLNILNTKLSYIEKHICYVDTYKTKCSQYNHITGEYVKETLNERWKQLDDKTKVQRDLYSAYLLMNMKTQIEIDMNSCFTNFDNFIIKHDNCVDALVKEKQEGVVFPSCMGI